MKILVEEQRNYGEVRYYPKGPAAITLTVTFGQKTLTASQLYDLNKGPYEVVVRRGGELIPWGKH